MLEVGHVRLKNRKNMLLKVILIIVPLMKLSLTLYNPDTRRSLPYLYWCDRRPSSKRIVGMF
jgi:hypothetical protein